MCKPFGVEEERLTPVDTFLTPHFIRCRGIFILKMSSFNVAARRKLVCSVVAHKIAPCTITKFPLLHTLLSYQCPIKNTN